MELHETKLMELRNKVREEKEMDFNTIMIAMEELKKERQKELKKIVSYITLKVVYFKLTYAE